MKKPRLTELLNDLSKTGQRKRNVSFTKKKETKKYQTPFKGKEDYWKEVVEKLEDMPGEIIEGQEPGCTATCVVEKLDDNDRKIVVEEEFVKSVGSDMKQFKWVIIEFNSWDSLIAGYPQALRFLKTKTNIGFGFIILIQEFEKCISSAGSLNTDILWQNKIQETVLVIKNLIVSRKTK